MEQKSVVTEEELKKRALSEAGISYSVCAMLPVLFSLLLSIVILALSGGREENWYADRDWYKYLCFLIPQCCFAFAAFLFFKRSRMRIRSAYRGCKWYFFPLAAVLQFGLTFSLSELNEYFVRFLELFGYVRQSSVLPSLGGWNLLPALIVIAVLPAVLEETIFRGIVTRQMNDNGWGVYASVLVCGALFSLFHHNPEQTIFQFFCGACFALVAIRSGSVFPTMLSHFLNNAVILALSAAYAPVYGEDFTMKQVLPAGGYVALCAVAAVALVAALGCLVFFGRRKEEKAFGVRYGKVFFLAASVGIALCASEWGIALSSGFVKLP